MIRNHTPNSPPDRTRKPLPVRMPAFQLDERAAFVEHVCGVLVESRYGPNSQRHPFEYFGQDSFDVPSYADVLPESAFDFMPTSAVPERLDERYGTEELRARSCEYSLREVSGSSSSVGASALSSPSTLGRGSPISFGTHIAEARTE